MNPRPDRNGAVSPSAIENREDGSRHEPSTETLESLRSELAALKAGIQAAGAVEPRPNERHCLDCFQRGRNAAIRAIVGA